jgi:HrpA-like RNA helicase
VGTGRTFPVTSYYLEDAFQHTGFEFAPTSPCLASQKGRDKGRKAPSAAAMAEEKRLRRYFLESLRQGKKYSEKTVSNLEVVEESVVNADLILKLVLHIVATDRSAVVGKGSESDSNGDAAALGAILIFVPGLANIQGTSS